VVDKLEYIGKSSGTYLTMPKIKNEVKLTISILKCSVLSRCTTVIMLVEFGRVNDAT
jgi:hypothetical protein